MARNVGDSERPMETTKTLLEWLSAFLLAVEAIKLENLRIIQTRLAGSANRIANSFNDSRHVPSAVAIGLAVALAILTYLGYRTADVLGWFPTVRTVYDLGLWLFVTALVLSTVGSIVIVLLLLAVAGLLALLELIQRNTANGIVGILGFAIFSAVSIVKLVFPEAAGLHP
jgi:hypothetical protein